MTNIIVDTREKGNIITLINGTKELKADFKAINDSNGNPVADYLLADMIIERSTSEDLIGKIISGRIRKQAKKLVEAAVRLDLIPVWIIEGDRWYTWIIQKGKKKKLHFNKKRVYSNINTLSLDYSISVILTTSAQNTVDWFVKRVTLDPNKHYSTLTNKVSLAEPLHVWQEQVLEVYKKIGPATAKALLIEGGTVANVLEMMLHGGQYIGEYDLGTHWSKIYKDKLRGLNDEVFFTPYKEEQK